MSAVVATNPYEPDVVLSGRQLDVRGATFTGTIVDVALDLGMQDDPESLARLLGDAVEIGAAVLRNGQSRALMECVTLEIDRLIETASAETEKLPKSLEEPLAAH